MATVESLQLTETIDNKRYYNILKDNIHYKLPSVTTILGAMTDKSGIEQWRKRIGEEEADKITKFSCNRGTCMHQKLEYFFTSDIQDISQRFAHIEKQMQQFVLENGYTEAELNVGNKLFDSLYICGFFNRVDHVIEMENTLFSLEQGGFAGRVDCIYQNKYGEKVLLDFKTAKHKKPREFITNYLMQLSAYYLCYYQMHNIKLDKAELWIAVENDAPQLVEINQEELKMWLNHFLGLVKAYHQKYDWLLEKREAVEQPSKNSKSLYEKLNVRSFK